MNRYASHVYVIPEDDRNRQLAVGFINHLQVDDRQIAVMPLADGWRYVLKVFENEYISVLRKYSKAHVVLLVDFDGEYVARRAEFDQRIPDDLKARVFVVGSKETPEILKRNLDGDHKNYETIGFSLAENCCRDTVGAWGHEHLAHNEADRHRLAQNVRSFLFVR